MEPCPGTDSETDSSLLLRIKRQTMMWQVSATDCQIRRRMLLSSDKGKKPHVQNPASHKGPVTCWAQH